MSGFDIGGPDGLGGAILPKVKLLGEQIRGDAPGEAKGDFGATLAEAIAEVDRLGHEVGDRAEELARGEPVEVHDLMIAMGKSEVAFNLMLEVRNKILDAWQQLSRSVG